MTLLPVAVSSSELGLMKVKLYVPTAEDYIINDYKKSVSHQFS